MTFEAICCPDSRNIVILPSSNEAQGIARETRSWVQGKIRSKRNYSAHRAEMRHKNAWYYREERAEAMERKRASNLPGKEEMRK